LIAGRRTLARKARRYAPRWIAVLGIGAYRRAFERPGARIGRQSETLGGAGLWVLPNPSGLNANHQLPELTSLFNELKAAVDHDRKRGQ
jgi:TDG/mug DNA glycosylase family protein